MKKKRWLPAKDDAGLRELNTEKVVNSFDRMGKFFMELKHQNRINFIVGLATGVIILVTLGTIVYSAYSAGGGFIDNIVDRDALTARYECVSVEGYNQTFRRPSDAVEFTELFNSSCRFYKFENDRHR